MAAELSDAFIRVVRVAALLRFLEAESVSVVHGFESPYRGPLYARRFRRTRAKRNMEEWERAARRACCGNSMPPEWRVPAFVLFFSSHVRPCHPAGRPKHPTRSFDCRNEGALDAESRYARQRVNDVLRRIECDILVAAPEIEAAGPVH